MFKPLDEVSLDTVYNGSFYTITGAGGDLNEWMEGYEKMLAEANIGKPKYWTSFKGWEVNGEYDLYGNNAYPNDIIFLAFPLDDLDTAKLAIFKLEHGDRWFDDIIDNALQSQEEEEEEEENEEEEEEEEE